ncbi:Glutathione S-transferase [Hibiscus syriacus]|uniref:glutathione transferase n=1 Tax=Hibiscus syriacus TaxID=106335 RepID=A0A6A2YAE0_HIBSY|nr:glutathione S-transferase PARB-like [Hibiscus syriacus]KAE8671309.1 Glutathione S-transferase [Hibiscus syriacus]
MAAIKVHGSPLSTATQRVLACLYEKGVDFQFVSINMAAGEHKSDNFLALNPFGQVPAFEDGDLKLFESRAITHYVAHEYADKGTQLLIPGSNKEAAVLTLWQEVEAQQFNSPSSTLAWELFYKPFFGTATDAAKVEENETKLGKVLDVYETRLSQSRYLASDYFTLADLYHLPNIQCLLATSAKKLLESRPHVNAWVKEITARPAWSKVLAMQKQ